MGNNRRPSKLTHFFYAFFLYFCRLRYVSLDGRINSHTIKIADCYQKTLQKYCYFLIYANKKIRFYKNFTKLGVCISIEVAVK